MSRPRYADKPDGNRSEIVDALREAGAVAIDMRPPVAGHPEVLVGYIGQLVLLELKTERGTLSEEQRAAHRLWARAGIVVHVVRTIRDAYEAVGIAGPVSDDRRAAMRELASAFEVPVRRRTQRGIMNARLQPSARNYTTR